jgi:aminodeoxyfutalosine deaminase
MRLLKADYVLPIHVGRIKDGLLLVSDSGEVLDCFSEQEIPSVFSSWKKNQGLDLGLIKVERYAGILCPGFINSHCHTELSYLKDKISQHTGLSGFVKRLQEIRSSFSDEFIQESIQVAVNEMQANGIVAVGDICNGISSIIAKDKSSILWHNFIEVFGFDPDKAEETFQRAKQLETVFNREAGNKWKKTSITPHAPYSVSAKLLKLIGDGCYIDGGLMSIHNQETEDENLFFKNKSGEIAEMLQHFGLNLEVFKASGQNSLPSMLIDLPRCLKLLLVHNTYTTAEDVQWATSYSKQIWWCLCPKANKFIENKLPDIKMFMRFDAKITLGTDSLASNDTLSLLDEIQVIHTAFPDIQLCTMLQWATKNGADYFGFSSLGSFEKGKVPGVNLVSGIDLSRNRILPEAQVKKLI